MLKDLFSAVQVSHLLSKQCFKTIRRVRTVQNERAQQENAFGFISSRTNTYII